jgi:phosphoribosylformimino-5-aminoimidazole carboxamide ribonucleotide (ProFAR) isomerase
MMGLEEELVRLLGQECPIPVTYAGGSELMGDLDRVKAIGSGSFFFVEAIGSGSCYFPACFCKGFFEKGQASLPSMLA